MRNTIEYCLAKEKIEWIYPIIKIEVKEPVKYTNEFELPEGISIMKIQELIEEIILTVLKLEEYERIEGSISSGLGEATYNYYLDYGDGEKGQNFDVKITTDKLNENLNEGYLVVQYNVETELQ